MTDADLIYNACLRAEKRAEAGAAELLGKGKSTEAALGRLVLAAVTLLREEIGSGLAKEQR